MPKQYDANFATEPPVDLPLSPKVKSSRKAHQDAEKAITSYSQENARYRTQNVALVGEIEPRYSSLALEEAKRELKAAEIAAVEAGKPLPGKDEFLAPVKAKMDEYKRTVEALKVLAAKAKQEYSNALFGELKVMGLKEAEKAYTARLEWEKAWKAVVAARATLEMHASLFSWRVTAGGYDTYPSNGDSQGERLEYWEITEDGRLKFESAKALDFHDNMVKVDGLIEPDPNPPEPVAEEFKYTRPLYHNSKPTWEGGNYVGEIY
ncbi:hypothetical protein [Streptomyces tendae]|uniref:hypothetical protein n=1 Tax=Streptomyces tendae TaxID=1932 RepID=UPI003720BA75